MSAAVIINLKGRKGTIWSLQTGIFLCLADETKKLFKQHEQKHVNIIYSPYEQLNLDEADETGFNLFYKYCKQVMENFPNTESGKQCKQEFIPAIQAQFAEVLRLMREDERYQEELQAA